MLSEAQRRQLLGLSLLALATFLVLSLVPTGSLGGWSRDVFASGNVMGPLGRLIRGAVAGLFGLGAIGLPVLAAVGGAVAFGWLDRTRGIRAAILALGLSLLVPGAIALPGAGAGLEGLADPAIRTTPAAAGTAGAWIAALLTAVVGRFGGFVVLLFALLALLVATLGWNPGGPEVLRGVRRLAAGLARGASRTLEWGRATSRLAVSALRRSASAVATVARQRRAGAVQPVPAGPVGTAGYQDDFADGPADAGESQDAEDVPGRRNGSGTRRRGLALLAGAAGGGSAAAPDPAARQASAIPPLELLSAQPPRDASLSERELDRLGDVLLDTLRTFRVEGEISGRTTGPVVTQYEVVPAPGIKVNKIAALDADLALALKAPSVRIVAPIPGKGAVGVEVPNPRAEVVYLRDILASPAFAANRGQLPIALGRDLTGKPYVADLARMPHLLIAGATGSGKSVCVNTLITSLVYRHTPDTLRLLMIDPKMVELSMYGDLPHLRHPVVTDPKDASFVLKWAVLEMERRYELLSENAVRSIAEFNRRQEQGQPLRRVEPQGEEGDPDRWLYADGPLPYIVVVVDELADLMMSVQSEIERPLAQLAQKARAIGIHLVVATQRPSVNVITGLIKANFPCRIAFRVSSKVDSRTILDQNGADALLGNGDMLFLPPGYADPVRVQGAYLPTEDTDRVMSWFRDGGIAPSGGAPEADIMDMVRAQEAEEAAEELNELQMEERDPLFRQAAEVCVQFQQGSTSLLQRRLRVGYGRAARIVDQLFTAGVLGPPDGSKPREVLVGPDSLDHICGPD